MEVFCQDKVLRNCAIRGLLKRKGKCHIDVNTLVVIVLAVPLDEMDSSDEEGNHGGGKLSGSNCKSQAERGFISGIFDGPSADKLSKTRITPRLFNLVDSEGNEVENYFDRSAGGGGVDEDEDDDEGEGKGKGKGNDNIDLNDL
jgi:hypothetical protein